MEVMRVPTVTDSTYDFEYLFALGTAVLRSGLHVALDFSDCRFLMQNGVAVLGGLARLVEYRGGRIDFLWDTLQPDVRRSVGRNGFMQYFGMPGLRSTGTAVPFRQDSCLAEDDLIDYLYERWIGTGRVNLSEALKSAIVSRTCEIYVNAFDHGHSPVGVFTSGQHYPRKKLLKLTVVDFGVGIPQNVRNHLALQGAPARVSGASAMQWAFQSGNTTKTEGIARGLGLKLLRDFVRINQGLLQIYSHDGQAVVGPGQHFSTRQNAFPATVVNITFSCDEAYYQLASETRGRPLFS